MNYCSLCGKKCDLIYKSMKNTTPISACCRVTVNVKFKKMLDDDDENPINETSDEWVTGVLTREEPDKFKISSGDAIYRNETEDTQMLLDFEALIANTAGFNTCLDKVDGKYRYESAKALFFMYKSGVLSQQEKIAELESGIYLRDENVIMMNNVWKKSATRFENQLSEKSELIKELLEKQRK